MSKKSKIITSVVILGINLAAVALFIAIQIKLKNIVPYSEILQQKLPSSLSKNILEAYWLRGETYKSLSSCLLVLNMTLGFLALAAVYGWIDSKKLKKD